MAKMTQRLIRLFVLAELIAYITAADSFNVACVTPTANTKGKIEVTASFDADPNGLYALGKNSDCGKGGAKVNFGTATGAGPFVYTWSIDLTGASTAETDCGFTTTANNPIKSSVDIVYQPDSVITKDAVKYPISCDWSTTNVQTKSPITPVTVTGAITAGTVGNSVLDSDMEVWVGGVKSNVMTLQSADVQIVLKIKDKTKLVNRAKVTDCKVANNVAMTGATDMYNDKGCGSGNTPWISTWKFIEENSANNNERYIKSTKQTGFYLDGTNEVHIQCKVLGCITGDAACDLDKCLATGRKRRAVQSISSNSTTMTTVIKIVDERSLKEGNKGMDSAHCLNHITWMSVVGVLALLLIVTLLVALYFGSKVVRSSKSETTAAYPNPAYKA